jgi:hypothetical protein
MLCLPLKSPQKEETPTKHCIAVLFALMLIATVARGQTQPTLHKMGLTAELCFLHPEDSGRMNVEESRILVSNYQQLTLMGGQAACLYVSPGSCHFQIEFLNSEDMFSGRSVSPIYPVILTPGNRIS